MSITRDLLVDARAHVAIYPNILLLKRLPNVLLGGLEPLLTFLFPLTTGAFTIYRPETLERPDY